MGRRYCSVSRRDPCIGCDYSEYLSVELSIENASISERVEGRNKQRQRVGKALMSFRRI